MNLSFVKLFSKRPASAFRVPHAVSARRMLGAAALAVWALAAVPAHAQDPSPDSDDTSVTLPDPLGAPRRRKTRNLCRMCR
ncbi:putative secreted protein [Paraburkholderia bryophila]|uniref:Putative secreted protein n=1 Tax=Paraburkholderia bryophila TaxID=420952 RepID=A0A7Z0B3D2_9BURK|nr:putative secreted protein [Paraburkholderia bryophila]